MFIHYLVIGGSCVCILYSYKMFFIILKGLWGRHLGLNSKGQNKAKYIEKVNVSTSTLHHSYNYYQIIIVLSN
jgi:hypothetical protein